MKRSFLAAMTICAAASAAAQTYTQYADSADHYIKVERWADAERMLVAAMRLEPGNFHNSLLLSNLGVVRTNMKRFDDALVCFESGLGIAPNSTVLLANRARTYIEMGRTAEAEADLTRVLGIDSTLTAPRSLRGYLRLGNRDFEGAAADFKVLLREKSDTLTAYRGLGYCALETGDTQQAEEMWTQVIASGPDEEAYLMRAIARTVDGRYPEASEDIRLGLEKNRHNGNLYFARGMIDRLCYRPDDAEINFRNAQKYGAEVQALLRFYAAKPK